MREQNKRVLGSVLLLTEQEKIKCYSVFRRKVIVRYYING